MVRNLPRRYTEQDLICELHRHVGLASIDYVYLPWDSARSLNNGHAFVNCVTASATSVLAGRLNGARWEHGQICRVINARPAITQGLAANIERYLEKIHTRVSQPVAAAGKKLGSEHRHPLVFRNGAGIPFAEAVDICRPFFGAPALENGLGERSRTQAKELESESPRCSAQRLGGVPPETLSPSACIRSPRWQPMVMSPSPSETFTNEAANRNCDSPLGAEMPVPSFLAKCAGHKGNGTSCYLSV